MNTRSRDWSDATFDLWSDRQKRDAIAAMIQRRQLPVDPRAGTSVTSLASGSGFPPRYENLSTRSRDDIFVSRAHGAVQIAFPDNMGIFGSSMASSVVLEASRLTADVDVDVDVLKLYPRGGGSPVITS